MTWQKGEVLSNQEPQRRQGEAGTLAQGTFNVAAWWRGQRSSYLLVLLWVGFKNGWWKSMADLLFQQMGVDDDADSAMPSPGELGRIASPAPSTSSSSSSCFAAFLVAQAVASAATSAPTAVATVASKPSTSGEKLCHIVKQSNADLQKWRHNCKNTMHLFAMVLADRFSCQVMDALTIVCRQMNEAFNFMRTTFKTLKGSVEWRRDMFHGAIEKGIIGTWASVCSLAHADWVRLIPGDWVPYCVASSCVSGCAARRCDVASDVQVVFFFYWTFATTYPHKLPGFFGQPDTNPIDRCSAQHEAFRGLVGSVGVLWSRRHVGGRFCSRPHVAS